MEPSNGAPEIAEMVARDDSRAVSRDDEDH
jgi:hypothetical protein